MRRVTATYYTHLATPIGALLLVSDGRALVAVGFPAGRRRRAPSADWRRDPVPLRDVADQLQAYFAGERREFALPLAPGGTPFQRRVWDQLRALPFGRTTTYGALAAALGRPTACRAVGAANGANPLPIIVPCHRVLGADGSLTGFGGGLPTKAWLLRHEGVLPPLQPP